MLHIKETIIVEGKYDKITLSQFIEANIIVTNGFQIFKNKEGIQLFRRLAQKDGVVILTDSDGAGFQIRNYLKNCLQDGSVKHAFIPEISGKEKRKIAASGQGLLGVEGMKRDILEESLRNAGCTILGEDIPFIQTAPLQKSDLFKLGLSGTQNSASLRKKLLKKCSLPAGMSANTMLDVLNTLYGREKFLELWEQWSLS